MCELIFYVSKGNKNLDINLLLARIWLRVNVGLKFT